MTIKNRPSKLFIPKLILGLALFTGLALWLFYFFLNRSQSKNITTQLQLNQISQEISKQQLEAKKTPDQNVYHLLEGWNFVSFPFTPDFSSASQLIQHVAMFSDGYITTVSQWDGDRWLEYTQRGAEKYGHDFVVKPRTAYFLRNHQETDWLVTGTPLTAEDQAPHQLQTGWNTLGITQPNLQAKTVIDQINQDQELENATVIDWWWSGDWDLYIKRHYSDTDVREYGNNFDIKNTRGYMVLLNYPTEWRPE